MTMKDWDDAYANMAHVSGSAEMPAHWAAEAARYRASGVKVEEDIAYGEGARQKLDIVWPEGRPIGLAVFVHGGYWMRLCKSDWTQFAEGARARGWAVALPGYTLTPAARITDITREIAAAIAVAGILAGQDLVDMVRTAVALAVAAVPARVGDDPVADCEDRRAVARGEIDPGVHAPVSQDRMPAHSVT